MRRNTFGFTYITFTCKYLLRCLRGGRRCQTCDGVIIAPRLTWPTHDGALFARRSLILGAHLPVGFFEIHPQ
jgi:hypothetical protein